MSNVLGSPGFLWSHYDKHQFLEVRGNGTEIFYSGQDHHIVEDGELGPIVKADRPIPKQGQFYFEVSIELPDKEICRRWIVAEVVFQMIIFKV